MQNMDDPDYLLALKLQQEYDKELNDIQPAIIDDDSPVKITAKKQAPKRRRSLDDNDYLNSTQNLVHPEWETLDPTPDVHSMFSAFDDKFFQGRLKCVLLEWSKRMYSCAGICYSRKSVMGMSITIRLSEPLLKLRPRKDLVETLLHEMIHAYCFVLGIREGNGGHGPNFKKIMHGINKVAGTNITVYHTFNDEVDLYKVHWWRCNGICQHRKPFYGYVKRTSNRAPGPNDFWWRGHSESCGGSFLKIKGPDATKKKGRIGKESNIGIQTDQKKVTPVQDLRKYFEPRSSISGTASNKLNNGEKTNIGTIKGVNNFIKGPLKGNGGGTLLLNPKTKSGTATKINNIDEINQSGKPAVTGGNLQNVVGLKDLGDEGGRSTKKTATSNAFPVLGQGYSLNTSSTLNTSKTTFSEPNDTVDRNKLREIWSRRFSQTNSNDNTKEEQRSSIKNDEVVSVLNDKNDEVISLINDRSIKIVSLLNDNDKVVSLISDGNDLIQEVPNEKKRRISEEWEVLSDDLCVKSVQPEIINLSDIDESSDEENSEPTNHSKPNIPLTQEERQIQIKKEIMDNSDFAEDDIDLIDDDYDDAMTGAVDLTDTSLVDDFFGDDVLLKDFRMENSVIPSGSRYMPDSNKDIVTCPICQSKVTREHLEDHLDGCIGISTKIEPKSYGGRVIQGSRIVKPSSKIKTKINNKQREALKKAGYSEKEIDNIKITHINTSNFDETNSDDENMTDGQRRRRGLTTSSHPCPICGNEVDVNDIDAHLKICNKSSPQFRKTQSLSSRINSTPRSFQDIPFQVCPICNKKFRANVMNEHLDLCLEEFDDE